VTADPRPSIDPRGRPDRVRSSADAVFRLLDRPITAADLDETTRRIGQPITPPERHKTSVLVFRVGEELLALAAAAVRRVTHPVRVHRIPHRTNAIARGLCSIEGELLLCGALPALLGLPQPEQADTAGTTDPGRMVVFGEPEALWAFQVDAVLGISHIDPDALIPAPVTVAYARDGFTLGLFPYGGRQAAVLDADRLRTGFGAALS
jgi:chemotaxis-related protein WspD